MNGIKVCLSCGGKSEWLTLPAGPEEARAAFQKIGAEDGGFHISACEAGFGGKLDGIIIGGDPDAVNYLAVRLSGLSPEHTELLDAMLESPLRSDVLRGIEQAVDFADNTGAYEVYHGVSGPEDLARYYIEESGSIQMPPEWAEGIDLERFGENLEKHEPGYYTSRGYLIATGLDWKPVFENGGEVPSKYRITPEKD